MQQSSWASPVACSTSLTRHSWRGGRIVHVHHLPLLEHCAQGGDVHVVDGHTCPERKGGGYPRCLTDHHVLRLHAQRRVRDVARREAHRHEKIACFRPPRQDHSIGNLIGLDRNLHVPFVLNAAIGL